LAKDVAGANDKGHYKLLRNCQHEGILTKNMHRCLTTVDETYFKLKTVGMCLDTLEAADLELTLALLQVGKGLLHDGNLLLHDSLSIADLPFEPVCCHGHKLLDFCLHLFTTEI